MNLNELYTCFKNSTGVTTDTRLAKPGMIFFALKGERDGNDFAGEAIKKGCSHAVVDDRRLKKNQQFIFADDSLKTLQALASLHRENLKIPVIAITGSNGKTTTKELISKVLSKKFKSFCTQDNYNNHIGVPLSILSVTEKTEIAIIEMGANHRGEIASLCNIAKPGYGLITNIGKAHIGEAGSMEGVIEMKKELYSYIKNCGGKIFINAADSLLMKLGDSIDKISYNNGIASECTGSLTETFPFLKINYKNNTIGTHLIGDFNFDNVMAAICIGAYFHVEEAEIKEALESYIPQNNRSQLIEKNGNTILLDAYNANPTSMELMVKDFIRWSGNIQKNSAVILGDMMELGDYAGKEHSEIINLCTALQINKAYFIGENFIKATANSQKDNPKIKLFNSTNDAVDYFKKEPLRNSVILIKGSRANKLEKIADAL